MTFSRVQASRYVGFERRAEWNRNGRLPIACHHPDNRGGKPCIRNLRITICDVLEYLASGMAIEDLLDGFPDL
jgi:hypothetical protein